MKTWLFFSKTETLEKDKFDSNAGDDFTFNLINDDLNNLQNTKFKESNINNDNSLNIFDDENVNKNSIIKNGISLNNSQKFKTISQSSSLNSNVISINLFGNK